MFYYVSDYYNTTTQTSNSDYATLVYYNNVSGGSPSNSTSYAYDLTNRNRYGPETAILQLPETTLWKNAGLYKNSRAILATSDFSTYSTSANGYTLPTAFSYKGYSARLLTANELKLGCSAASTTSGSLDNCKYLMENTYYQSTSYKTGYWFETPNASDSSVWIVNGNTRALVHNYSVSNTTALGVRPVIDVKKTDIKY